MHLLYNYVRIRLKTVSFAVSEIREKSRAFYGEKET